MRKLINSLFILLLLTICSTAYSQDTTYVIGKINYWDNKPVEHQDIAARREATTARLQDRRAVLIFILTGIKTRVFIYIYTHKSEFYYETNFCFNSCY